MSDDKTQALQHRLAMYEQLSSLYPREPEHLQKRIEVLLQLQEDDAAALLLETLYQLLLSQGEKKRAEASKRIRQHLSQQQHQEHFYSTPFLHLASSSFVKKAFRTHRRVQLKAGEYLIHYGEQDEQMFIVLSGELAVWSRDNKGKKQLQHTLRAGEVIGELAFLDGTPRNADVLACQDAMLLAIPRNDVLKLLMENPKVEQALRQEADVRKILVEMKKNADLARLPDYLQRMLAKSGRFEEIDSLTRLYQCSQNIETIDLICNGSIRMLAETTHGESVVVDNLKVGGLLGLAVINLRIEKHQYIADIVCMQQARLVRFPAQMFINIIEHNPRLHQTLIKQSQREQDMAMQSMQGQGLAH